MPTFAFGLFGATLSIHEGTTSFTAIGGASVALEIQLDTSRSSLTMTLKGTVLGIEWDFKAVCRIRLQGGDVVLAGIMQSTMNRVALVLDAGPGGTFKISNPTLRVSEDRAIALEVVDEQGTALTWLKPGLPRNLDPDMTRPALRHYPDLRRAKTIAIPAVAGSPFFQQADLFQVRASGPGIPSTKIGAMQRLDIREIAFASGRFQLDLRPATGALFAHADVLDTARKTGNELLFQYALVNGLLRVGGDATASAMTWVADPALKEPAALLLLRFQDEHGHPVALEIKAPEVSLTRRMGRAGVVSSETLPKYWEQVNEALVIGPPGASAAPSAVPVRLVQLDPLPIYKAYSQANLRDIAAPPFIVSGVAKLKPAPPSELHGLSRGAWLRRSATKAKTAADATFTVAPVMLAGAPAFHHTELVLTDVTAWEAVVLREERDLKPDRKAATGPVGAYTLAAKKKAELRLPAIDLSFALSNLAGSERRGPGGQPLGTGILYQAGRVQLTELEDQFCRNATRFDAPAIDNQQHVTGMRVAPADQVFARMLDILPTAAPSIAEAGRIAPELKAAAGTTLKRRGRPLNTLVLGGAPGTTDAAETALIPIVEQAQRAVEGAFESFERNWRALAADPDVRVLRDAFFIKARQLQGLSKTQLAEFQRIAIDYLSGTRNTADITAEPEGVLRYLNDVAPDEFAAVWQDASDPGLKLLWEHVWAPADRDLLRRIVRWPGVGSQLITKLFGAGADLALLKKFLVEVPAQGMITQLDQGLDEYWNLIAGHWAQSADAAITRLRTVYGPLFTRDVYQKLLAAVQDAEALVQSIRENLGLELERLSDLATEPPEYLLRTQRFRVKRQPGADETLVKALWSQCFDLCAFPGKQWLFFLDSGTTLILKLSRKRGLDTILREIVANYRAPDRPDPLGLEQSLDAFLSSLDPDLTDPNWVGAFLVRPVADISNDVVLRDLAGFEYITGSYVAIGGQQQSGGQPPINVWAHIFKQRAVDPDRAPLDQKDPPPQDVGLALTKFDVRVRQTRLSAADIEIEIHPKDILGKDAVKYPTVTLRGSLEQPADENAAPDLTYAAFFPNPVILEVKLAIIERLELKSLRVVRFNGVTCIDIDAGMVLRDPKLPALDLSGLDGKKLHLESFRIPLPSLSPMKVEMGVLRKLAFDFPAASFTLPDPRTFNLFGVDLTPTGVGYVRGAGPPFERLKRDYVWLNRLDLGSEPTGFVLPYLEMSLDFGKSPVFGGDARGLKFNTVLAFKVTNGSVANTPFFGISGLDARDIKFDIFRILSVEAERLAISNAELWNDGEATPKQAGAILAQQLKLKIFNWSPAPKDAVFDLLFLHPRQGDEPASRKGMLAFYDAKLNQSALRAAERKRRRKGGGTTLPMPTPPGAAADKDSFFKVFWILLAHNMSVPDKALSYLLSSRPDQLDPETMLDKLLVKPPDPGQPDKVLKLKGVRLLEEESWLFGISFKLGELFTRCNMLLQDQHYYGIRLYAPWVEKVFKQDSIELAYIPGPTASQDRFRTNLRIPALDMLGFLKSGEVAFEWGVNWDFLVDIGFPWSTANGYDWFRAFSIPVGTYEGKLGFFIEKRTVATQTASLLTLSAGLGFYVGYFFSAGNSVAWVRAGIGVFAILQGSMTFRLPQSKLGDLMILKSTLQSVEVTGVIGVFAYGEGGVDVWILSARFRVSAQASLACTIRYVSGSPCVLTYSASLAAQYSASCRVGSGWCSWTFHVHGQVGMAITGQLLLS